MRPALTTLEEPYRSRAVPPGTLRYFSWLFAAPQARDALLDVYALMAEWRALLDHATDLGVGRIKLAWWREEINRLSAGEPLHPITRHIAALPGAGETALAELARTLEAVEGDMCGVPLERASDLEPHAEALMAVPLRLAARLGGARGDVPGLRECTAALATGEYLAQSLNGYRSAARAGRNPFAIEELLAAGIEDGDLAAREPPQRLATYLETLRGRADRQFSRSLQALAPAERPLLRHLCVLAVLGAKRLNGGWRPVDQFRLTDLYVAWKSARRAAAGR